jgi:hypothetical protein
MNMKTRPEPLAKPTHIVTEHFPESGAHIEYAVKTLHYGSWAIIAKADTLEKAIALRDKCKGEA